LVFECAVVVLSRKKSVILQQYQMPRGFSMQVWVKFCVKIPRGWSENGKTTFGILFAAPSMHI